MITTLEPGSNIPLYAQIREGLREQIEAGSLAPGMRLPSSRQLAADLRVSRITVTNAYAELEADGLIESRAGSGTFVAPTWHRPGVGAGAVAALPRWQHRSWGGTNPV